MLFYTIIEIILQSTGEDMKEKEMDTFAVGDKVVWASVDQLHLTDLYRKHVEEYGRGPFMVIEVVDIPADECVCGISRNDPDHFFSKRRCYQTMRESTGHHQQIVVADPATERPLMRKYIMPGPIYWSGLWFEKIGGGG